MVFFFFVLFLYILIVMLIFPNYSNSFPFIPFHSNFCFQLLLPFSLTNGCYIFWFLKIFYALIFINARCKANISICSWCTTVMADLESFKRWNVYSPNPLFSILQGKVNYSLLASIKTKESFPFASSCHPDLLVDKRHPLRIT